MLPCAEGRISRGRNLMRRHVVFGSHGLESEQMQDDRIP